MFRGVSLACALAMPAVALGAPKGDDASDDGGAAKKGGKKGKKADDDGDVEASVSSSGASAAAGSGKGAPMKGRFGIGAMRSLSATMAQTGSPL